MSNPPNRLASFRSYSYYHVLAMCDSSQTADALARSTELNVWEHTTPEARVSDNRPQLMDLGKYSPKRIEGAGKYIILINGSTDAAFVINRAKWSTMTGASARPGDRSTSIAVEGTINISEPKGVAFLDQVVKCSVALGVDSAQVVYVLKTFFIGFRDDDQAFGEGGNRQDFIADIPPVMFIVYDATGSFTESGGMYEMSFVATSHGASRLPQYSKAVNGMSVTAGDSLQQTLTKLQDNINDSYNKYYNCVYEQIKQAGGDNEPMLKAIRKVQYIIEVGPDYQDSKGIKYTVTNQSQQYKNTAGCNDPVQVTFPPHTSIETAIGTIMMMSPQVQADMAVGDTSTKIKYEYKIHTALVSEQAGDAAEGIMDYKVYYRVERFMSPKTIAYTSAFDLLQSDIDENTNPEYQKIKQNIIEFDYMYTGKNIDILEFDIKVNMGMAYLQTATLASTFKSQLERAPNRQTQPATGDINNHMVKFGSIVQTPIFFGSQIKTPSLTNSQNGSHTIQSAYTLNKHASLEVSDVTMKIIGNTRLLGTANLTTSSKYTVESATRSTEFTPADKSEANFADWSFAPAYAKVKIKMPRENDDFSLFTGTSVTGDPRTDPDIADYARDFWFDGYYYVIGIEHIFDGGEFSQVLSMLGLPKRSAFESTQANATREVEITTNVGKCFDNQIGATPDAPAVAVTPPSGDTYPTNRPDAESTNQSGRSPSDVVNWENASPAVKAAIIDASNKYKVDAVVMAQFAQKESNFVADAKARTSSATGLYQFITSTWNGLVKQGKVPGVTPASPDLRKDPQYNAYAGAIFLRDNARMIGSKDVGDLYLAHFLGPGRAKLIIARDNATGGQELLITVIGKEATLKIAKANPSIVKPNMTVGELRTWARVSMSKTLKKPVNVARQQTPNPPTQPGGQTLTSSNPENTKRTADQPIAAVQNDAVQTSKTDINPCGHNPNKPVQDRPRGGT